MRRTAGRDEAKKSRAALARSATRERAPRARDLVGRDIAHLKLGDPRRAWFSLLAIAVPFALCIAGLRIDLLRLRYELPETEKIERALAERHRMLVAESRGLRHPEKLASEARRLGFVPPTRVVRMHAKAGPAAAPAARPPRSVNEAFDVAAAASASAGTAR